MAQLHDKTLDEVVAQSNVGTVTVIVPAYNAERYLDMCLDSVLAQPEVGELLVIDDGSLDSTPVIVEKYASLDARVELLSQTNSGVSVARNNGIEHASRQWLAFVDADDIVLDGAFAALCDCSVRYDADICYGRFGILSSTNDSFLSHEFGALSSGRISVRSVIENLASMSPESLSGSCWRMLFRTSFVKGHSLTFPVGIRMSEDYSFILQCLSHNPAISYTDEVVYLVRREGDSVTQRYQPYLARDMDVVNGQLRQVCSDDEKLMSLYWANVASTAWCVCRNVYKHQTSCTRNERFSLVKETVYKYREALWRFGFHSGMQFHKALLLKLAVFSPRAFWWFLEVNARSV